LKHSSPTPLTPSLKSGILIEMLFQTFKLNRKNVVL
jgi:hypothetical protein